jgi:bacterioferritin-associated ferredoxin
MVVCLCQGVTERQVREAIADGATTRKKVTRACGAGAGCGGCHESIREILREHRAACGVEPGGDDSSETNLAAPAVRRLEGRAALSA